MNSFYNIFFLNVLMFCIFGWVWQIFLNSHFFNMNDLFFIKSDDSPLINLIELVVITFSIWMILCMRNYARFQVKIDLSRAISTIKDFTCLVGNSFKSSMRNDMFDFKVLKFFDINTRSGKVHHPLLVRWEFPSLGCVKIKIDGAVGGSHGLATSSGIFVGVWRGYWWFLCFPWYPDCFSCWVLWSYTCYWRN